MVARMLVDLSDTDRLMGLREEGIQQAKEALEIFEQLGHTVGQGDCLTRLALLFRSDKQFDAAEEAAFRAIALLPEKGEPIRACRSHRVLGEIYQSKGETKKAIHHFEVALGIASPFSWHSDLFGIHYQMAELSRDEGRFDGAQTHIERAKSYAADSAYNLGLAMELQALVWYRQHRLEEARSEALRAADIFDKLGAKRIKVCREFLQKIGEELNTVVAPGQSGLNCELL